MLDIYGDSVKTYITYWLMFIPGNIRMMKEVGKLTAQSYTVLEAGLWACTVSNAAVERTGASQVQGHV